MSVKLNHETPKDRIEKGVATTGRSSQVVSPLSPPKPPNRPPNAPHLGSSHLFAIQQIRWHRTGLHFFCIFRLGVLLLMRLDRPTDPPTEKSCTESRNENAGGLVFRTKTGVGDVLMCFIPPKKAYMYIMVFRRWFKILEGL